MPAFFQAKHLRIEQAMATFTVPKRLSNPGRAELKCSVLGGR
ncbi:MAG: hypothetical protein ABH934_00270 [Chloroflexota bacterium]